MISSQQSAWGFVKERLLAGMVIRNWTAKHGYIDGSFVIREINSHSVRVEPPQGRVVSAADFETIGQMWSGYLAGHFNRPALRNVSHNSQYVISILHQFGYQQLD